ncbi:MAG: precorrin-4 C(11)-methyltransferase [Clostridia bacterium]|nr:precorrin-4 C(11)-methyltransferase [Clostridia bacterium]
MVHIIGAGCGAADLITLRGKKYLEEADVIIYAGSLVNKELLQYAKDGCALYDSAKMTLEEILAVIEAAEAENKMTVRLQSGDPSLYGAIGEQMREFDKLGIAYDITPGVSAFSGAAAALKTEYTLPDVSQTVIITRASGKTVVPKSENLRSLAAHGATMVLFLSTGLLAKVTEELIAGGYSPDAPAAIVYKASWDDEKVCRCTVATLEQTAKENNITKTALITVGGFLNSDFSRSHLYDPNYATEFREASK